MRLVISRVVWLLLCSLVVYDNLGFWWVMVLRMWCRCCCLVVWWEVFLVVVLVVVVVVVLVSGGVGLLGWVWVVVGVVDLLMMGDISELFVVGEEGVIVVLEMGLVGVGGVVGGVVIGGCRLVL